MTMPITPSPITDWLPTRLLVSVRHAGEAAQALAGQADILDIKEPAHGPLGMADLEVMHAIAQANAGSIPLSAAMGELIDHHHTLPIPDAVRWIKIGLARMAELPWRETLQRWADRYPGKSIVATAYWDHDHAQSPRPEEILQWAITHQAAALLIDTHDKTGPGLLGQPDDAPRLRAILSQARQHGLPVALAGRLMGSSFDAAIALQPAIVGVRSAACVGGKRSGAVTAAAIAALKDRIRQHFTQAAHQTCLP